jgi:hypothetical protein
MARAPHAVERALEIALRAHRGAVDKAGAPYILHPLRVMFAVAGEDERLAAILHDVVEDGDVTLDDLTRAGMPEAVVRAVDALTRRPDEDYAAFIDRVALDPVARAVKRADLDDNLDVTRLTEVGEKDRERINKYLRSRRRLLAP